MAKALIVFKIIIAISVIEFISNGDCFKITTKEEPSNSTEINTTLITTLWNLTDSHLVTKDKVQLIGELVLKVAIFIYSCLAIALLCDEYFVPSLELIGKAFNLPSDITGAILIPIGTSGPEIFSSAVGVFFTENDIGTGAIIGSAVFNLLAIPASCGIAVAYFIGKPIKLEQLSILRDLLFYILSIIVLILVIKDNSVDLMDASLLALLFLIYVGVMIYNAKLSMRGTDRLNNNHNKSDMVERYESTPLLNEKALKVLEQLTETLRTGKQCKVGYEKIGKNVEDEDDECGLMNNCILRWLLFPMTALYYLTMPKKFLVITFFISIGWLSGLSYFTVWSISGLSDTLGIPPTISGMTILAAGSAVPDLVTSIIVIRKHGLASMGICAAIASNIFAIVVGLGLPWLLQCLINFGKTGDYAKASISIESDALPYTSILLLITIFGLLFTLKACKWQLFKKFSIICVVIHVIFMASSVTLELLIHS